MSYQVPLREHILALLHRVGRGDVLDATLLFSETQQVHSGGGLGAHLPLLSASNGASCTTILPKAHRNAHPQHYRPVPHLTIPRKPLITPEGNSEALQRVD